MLGGARRRPEGVVQVALVVFVLLCTLKTSAIVPAAGRLGTRWNGPRTPPGPDSMCRIFRTQTVDMQVMWRQYNLWMVLDTRAGAALPPRRRFRVYLFVCIRSKIKDARGRRACRKHRTAPDQVVRKGRCQSMLSEVLMKIVSRWSAHHAPSNYQNYCRRGER